MISAQDIERQVEYWRANAVEDLASGEVLVRSGHERQGLFFVHLALEKVLKAHVTRATKDVAPKIHSLTRLAELSGLTISVEMRDVLGETGRFNIAGRYPDEKNQPVPIRAAQARVKSAKEVFRWLTMQL